MAGRKETQSARSRRRELSPRDAEATRGRIFESARVLFSEGTYEGVGVRDIASAAKVDPALVMRYFGSKERLFAAVAAQAFDARSFLRDGAGGLAESLADTLMSPINHRVWGRGYDPLRLLLGSIGSPVAAPILAEALSVGFLAPIAASIRGRDAAERGVMLTAQVVGLALMRIVQAAQEQGEPLKQRTLRSLFVDSARAIVAGPGVTAKT